ncbi:MAG: hypothetical protein NVSMB18_23800 [Acetobacteraceae bacterium]
MSPSLLATRRFLPLFLTQALGALNDNLFKNALVVLVVFRSAEGGASLVAIAGGLFILPYMVVSAPAGQLADRFDKARLIRIAKAAELAIMAVAALGMVAVNLTLLLAVLFALGAQAAFFGPLKYGILPEHLASAELLRGNALVEAGTFGAILAGTIAGGVLIGLEAGPEIVAAAGLAVAALGLATAFAIPPARPAAPALPISGNLLASSLALLRTARQDRPIWACILGLSWFWAMGATFLAEFPVLAKADFHADNRVVTLLLTGFALGVGAGSMLAGRLGRGAITARYVPLAAALLSALTVGFAWLAGTTAAASWSTPSAMLASPAGVAALACLFGAAASGGLYSVPLYALIQGRADPARRARMIAANNIMNAVFMVLGAGVIAALAAFGVSPRAMLTLAAGLNLAAALLMRRACRSDLAGP